ncbi:MAG: T9SS type A sorting domain-containing protein [bacterium]|nr:T9SS type A sorting domain-containing protein [bacterium]
MKSKLLLICSFFLLIGSVNKAFAQVPSSNFSLSASAACLETSILITDLSTESPSAWSYSLNGVPYSTLQNVSVSFSVAGTYTISMEATNGTGVGSIMSATVLALPLPILSVSGATQVCLGASVSFTASGADTYTWDAGVNTDYFTTTPLTNTIYIAEGSTTLTGCTNSISVSVVVNSLPAIGVNSGAICQGTPFTLIPSGGISYTYSAGTDTVTPFSTSSYTVIGGDINGCVNTAVSEVTVFTLPIVSVNSGSICMGSPFVLLPSGALSYTYSSGTNTVMPIVSNSSFTVTGEDANGCINTAVSTVTAFFLPVVSVNSGSICEGDSFVMIPSGAFSYTFSNGSATVSPLTSSSFTISGESVEGCLSANSAVSDLTVNLVPVISVNSASICSGTSFTMIPSGASTYIFSNGSSVVSPLTNASYSVTGTSAEGCLSSNIAVSDVTVVASPVVSVNSGTLCAGTTFVMAPSGAVTYTFSNGTATVSPLVTTSYSVLGTNSEGCVSILNAVSTISVDAIPLVSVNSGSICTGSNFVMIPSGAATYSFSNGSATVTPLANASYSVSGESAMGCLSSNVAVSNVTVNLVPVVSVNSASICSGTSFTMVPTGASTYTYSGGSAVVSPTVTTSYTVSGTSAEGCLSSNTAVSDLTVSLSPLVSVNSGTICAGNSFVMNPSGALSYTYSNGSQTVSPTTNTSYTVTGSNADGCISINTAVSTVTVRAIPVLSVNSGSICAGTSFVMAPSGASTYTYSNGSATVNPLTNSSYSVTGTSIYGCVSANAAVSTLTVNAVPVLSTNSGTICSGNIFVMNPTGAITYTISGGTATVNPVSSSSYTITGTSPEGCISPVAAISTVTVYALPLVAVSGPSAICSGATSILTVNGATSYLWNNSSTTNTISVTPASSTTYSVVGTDVNGCVNSAAYVLMVNITPTISVNSGSMCQGTSFIMFPTGASSYTFSSGSPIVAPSVTSSYTVTGSSAAGCVAAFAVVSTVTVYAAPVITANSGAICIGSVFTITPGGASTYTISGGSSQVSPTISTSYTVIGTSNRGCVAQNGVFSNVAVNALPSVFAIISSSAICAGENAVIKAAGANSYVWNTGAITSSIVMNPVTTTTYTVTGTDTKGCSNSASVVQKVNSCTGLVNQTGNDQNIMMYPNPTKGEFTIETSQATAITVLNAMGQVVLKQQLSEGKNPINFDAQIDGVYFVHFLVDGQNKTLKVIKN